MNKRYLIILLFFVYVILLLLLAGEYESREQNFIAKGFLSGFGDSLGSFFRYIAIALLISSTFLILVYFIHHKLSFLFILLAPFVNVVVAFVVWLLLDFVLWITQLDGAINVFQKTFIIAVMSTIGTALWILRNIFKSENERRDMHTTQCL